VTARLVSIVGPPSVGKTTLALWLAQALPAEFIREDYEGNPYLADAYAGVAEARLPSQMYFLLSRVEQLAISAWPAGGCFVSDYGFCQDSIFAHTTLTGDDLHAYEKMARRLGGLVQRPDVLIHLDASVATLLDRIARRGRSFEKSITAEFLSSMRQAHARAVAEEAGAVIRVDCDKTDLLDSAARECLLAQLRGKLG
jgi:deoxyadenosine/deoxycytidine kinase